jgi:hypothetical protein
MGDAFDGYSPLTPDELAAGPAIARRMSDDGVPVFPVPADAPAPPTRHFNHGEPTATWTYRDAVGAELCRILRFDFPDGRKEFCPLTLWRNAKGLRWRWKALCAPRPLYGLDRLADNPYAPVIVCEGEKAADAAAKVFPDHAAVTSSGGSQAAAKSDWSLLSGRKATIWPDNDEPGANYANEVAAILTRAGCEVSVIDANALTAVDGGAHDSNFEPIGWDAANALAEWADSEALRSAALRLAKPFAATEAGAVEAKPSPSEENISVKLRGAATVSEIKSAAATLNKDDIEGAKRLIEAALAAKANQIEADQIIKALARSFRVPKAGVEQLWRDIEQAKPVLKGPGEDELAALSEAGSRERVAKRAELFEQCKHIATNPRLLDEMASLVRSLGVVGERHAILAAYVTATSRLSCGRAISLLRRGAAASGKNHLVESVFKLVPPESIVAVVGGSPKSLAYYGGVDADDALQHKVIYVPEAAAIADKHGVESEFTTMLRVLISESRLVYQTVQTQEDGPPITVTATKNGPIAVVITSARANIEEEMMTRLMVVDADESSDQTRAIIENTLTDRQDAVAQGESSRWLDFQRWLELGGPYDVIIPYISAVRQAHSDEARLPLRYRRDIANFLTAIKTSAIIHSAQRKRDERGRVVADLNDYDVAHAAFDRDMGGLYSVNVPDTIKAVVRAVEAMVEREKVERQDDGGPWIDSAKVTYDSLMAALGINSNDTAGRRLKEALRLGLIEQVEPQGGLGKTTARRYRVLVPSVELEERRHGGVFPSPDAVRNAMQSENCTGYTAWTASSAGEGERPSIQERKALSNPGDLGTAPARRVLRGKI